MKDSRSYHIRSSNGVFELESKKCKWYMYRVGERVSRAHTEKIEPERRRKLLEISPKSSKICIEKE